MASTQPLRQMQPPVTGVSEAGYMCRHSQLSDYDPAFLHWEIAEGGT